MLSIPQLTRPFLYSSTPSRTASTGMWHGFNSVTALYPLGRPSGGKPFVDYCCQEREGPKEERPARFRVPSARHRITTDDDRWSQICEVIERVPGIRNR